MTIDFDSYSFFIFYYEKIMIFFQLYFKPFLTLIFHVISLLDNVSFEFGSHNVRPIFKVFNFVIF